MMMCLLIPNDMRQINASEEAATVKTAIGKGSIGVTFNQLLKSGKHRLQYSGTVYVHHQWYLCMT
ncbi:hypothetical protein DPMN_052138 [Dreissena polymorpha]|uniref:Uncharacterized protein n=1 Tax=Dreissena polymorpha TaxID=45954 RepID=A0A9D4HPL7_DREPO|nr:hypothetical protein DPMN_052138 [Dreissena polymorpha]